MARKPECGRKPSAEYGAELMDGFLITSEIADVDENALFRVIRSWGCEPHEAGDVTIAVCRICRHYGERTTPCSPTKHAAYYDALERGEIEPIRMEEREAEDGGR